MNINRTSYYWILYVNIIVSTVTCSTGISEEIKYSDLLDLLESVEQSTQVIEYKLKYKRYIADPTQDYNVDFSKPLLSWKSKTGQIKAEKDTYLLFEPESRRIRIKREGLGQVRYGGNREYYTNPTKRDIGFNGTLRTEVSGVENPYAMISNEPLQINKTLSSLEAGMDLFLATFQGIGIRSYLANEADLPTVQGVLKTDGKLIISYETKEKAKYRIIADIARGGILLSKEFFDRTDETQVISKIECKWKKNSDGYWMPESAINVAGISNSVVRIWEFQYLKVNHIKPSSDMFQVDFPNGIEIFDRTAGIVYRKGPDLKILDAEVTKSLEEVFVLNPSLQATTQNTEKKEIFNSNDKNSKVTDVCNISNISNDHLICEEKEESRTQKWFLWVLVVLGALLLTYYMRIKGRFNKNRTTTILLIIAFLVVLQSSSKSLGAAETSNTQFNGWNLYIGGKKIPIYQCGLNSSMFILKYFNINFKTKQLMNLMSPGTRGIALSEIIDLLELHGLETSTRTSVTAKDLLEYVTTSRIVLLPVSKTDESGHYYAVLPGRDESLLLVDGGRSVKKTKIELFQKMLDTNNGVTTFVWKNANRSKDALSIDIDKELYDIGSFYENSEDEISAKFILSNLSSKPILVINHQGQTPK